MIASTPEEIHAMLSAAFRAGDLEAFLELYEPGATLIVPPEGRQVSGREEIRVAVEPTIAQRPRFSSDVERKLEADGIALTCVRWRADGEGEDAVAMEGRGAVVSRRQRDGGWRILLDNPMSGD
jgi:uncharacterized protein (TIGR02246 family)